MSSGIPNLSCSHVGSNGDIQAKACYDNMKKVEKFCNQTLGNNTFFDKSRPLDTYIHHQNQSYYNSACWVPNQHRVIFGEVDPQFFNPFTESLDIVAHELGHGRVQYSSNLHYSRQSGALNESYADILAVMVKHSESQMQANDPNADWLIGANCIKNRNGTTSAIRSFSHPGQAFQNHQIFGSDMQVSHMNYFVNCLAPNFGNDFGYVHRNAGIPNHAFYLAATGLQGPTHVKAGKVWDAAMIASQANETFSSFAQKTVDKAREFHFCDGEINIIGQAWTSVGINPTTQANNAQPNSSSSDWSPWIVVPFKIVGGAIIIGGVVMPEVL